MPDNDLWARVDSTITGLRLEFATLSSVIHADPELAFAEHRTSKLLCDHLARAGFSVAPGTGGLETAFAARFGSGSPHIALLVEYDALPEIGHACGHNLIAAGGVTAAVALRHALPDCPGTLSVIGTPAEEGGGGKVLLLEAGVFDDVDAALMFHPADRTLAWRHAISSAHLRVSFHGVAAHAAKNPEDGRNALAALIQLFVAIDGLRQHIGEKARIHGVIRHGGAAPNVVPDFTSADFLVRDVTRERALDLVERFVACANGAALSTGTTVTVEHTAPVYAERKNNHTIADRVAEHLSCLGISVEQPNGATPAGSSDIGNVSLALPTVHPYIQIADRGTPSHSTAFRDAAASERAQDAAFTMATAIARTAADLLTDPALLAAGRREFETSGPDTPGGATG